MSFIHKTRRIGITGSSRAGKTVFLLSLIQHLEAHKLDLKKGSEKKEKPVRTSMFNRLPCNHGWLDKTNAESLFLRKFFSGTRNEFDYEKFIGHLGQGKWPAKTTDSSFFRCKFQLNGFLTRTTEIEFFDFPGERLADVTMLGRDFSEWSDKMFETIHNDPTKERHAKSFLSGLENPNSSAGREV